MKNTKKLNVGLAGSLFVPGRMVYMANPPEALSASSRDNLLNLGGILASAEKVHGSEILKTLPKEHPLEEELLKLADKFAGVDPESVKQVEKKDGVFVLKIEQPDGTLKDFRIEGMGYAALFWPEVRDSFSAALGGGAPAGVAFDKVIISALADKDSAASVRAAIEAVTTGKKVDPKVIESARKVVESLKVAAAPEASKERAGMK
ncbi:hypothetical protein HN709_01320, partial [Candidatus Peregrinibacteria bacterium]|nr:hypothetical protein [Candidatus Peregrinibacteria bacterium]